MQEEHKDVANNNLFHNAYSKDIGGINNMEVLLNKEQQAIYNNGGIALGVRADTYQKVRVCNVNGKMCIAITTASAYTKVNPYMADSSALNLTMEETREAFTNGSVQVFRSSGAKDENGNTLTREQQIKQGCARVIDVVVSLKAGAREGSQDYNDYEWLIIKDNATRFEPIK